MANEKRVLAVMSEYGYWGIELVGPLLKLEAAGYKVDIITPKGNPSPVLPPSTDITYIDPPLGICVTTKSDAELVEKFERTNRTSSPMDLSFEFPERPYYSNDNFLRSYEDYCTQRKSAQAEFSEKYEAVLLVGGSGPIIDMVNNQRLHDLVLGFYERNMTIAAICYGVAVLPFARDLNVRQSIIKGKHVTGHCVEYDYHDGTGFMGTDLNMGPPPYTLEYIIRDSVGDNGQYHGNFGAYTSVIVDYPFITARSLQCSHEFGEQMVNMLDNGLTRYGW